MNRSKEQREKEQRANIHSKMLYEGNLFSVQKVIYEWPHEPPLARELVIHPGAVAILPIMTDGRLLTIRQWRSAASEILIEIPAGVLEPGEEIAVCADRELREETGFRARTWKSLGTIYSAPGFTNEKLYLFIATGLEEDPLSPDEHEAIDLHPLTLEEALTLIETGVITDAKTIVAILRYAREQK